MVAWRTMNEPLLSVEKQVCNCMSKIAFYILVVAFATCYLIVKFHPIISVFLLCVT